jgi:hypothetical protein
MTEFIDHRLPSHPCPECRTPLDAAGSLSTDDRPVAGDASVCWHCGALLIFGEDLRLRAPTKRERREVERMPEMREAVRMVQAALLPKLQ